MKVSFLSIGIEVAEAVVEVFRSETSPDPGRSEGAGLNLPPSVPQRYRAEVSIIFGVPDGPDPWPRAQGRGAAGQLVEALSPVIRETGRLGLKAALARSALIALPALAVLAAPRIASAALPAARKSTFLRGWVRGLLPAQPRRLHLPEH
jgi:hypothetical protein